jgi:redox-sensing transcriptional repressor
MPDRLQRNCEALAKVPEATIHRLPIYLSRLKALRARGVAQVSSRELAEPMNIKPGQLRHDFHYFGNFSRPGRPYEVEILINRLSEIMCLGNPTPYIIAGAGLLGQAIANYSRFEEDGFLLRGIFDINPRILGMTVNDLPIRHLEEMSSFLADEGIQIGAIAVPPSAAQDICDQMLNGGVLGIWNFAPVDLKVADGVVLQDEFLSVGLMALNYKVKAGMRQA